MSKKNPNRGSTFSDFLKEDGVCEDTTTLAAKRVSAWQLEQAVGKEAVVQKPDGHSHEHQP